MLNLFRRLHSSHFISLISFLILLDDHVDSFYSTVIIVSSNGRDIDGCGGTLQPCHSITYALPLTNREGGEGVIVIRSDSKIDWDWLCTGEPLLITHSVAFRGFQPRTRIGCSSSFKHHRLMMFNITTGSDHVVTGSRRTLISFIHLHLIGIVLYVSNSSVRFKDSFVENSRWKSIDSNPFVELETKNSEFQGKVDDVCSVNCGTSTEFDVQGMIVAVDLRNSTFRHSRMQASARHLINVNVHNCTFTSVIGSGNDFLGGLNILVESIDQPSRINVTNTRFENMVHNDPVQSVMNILDAGLIVRVRPKNKQMLTGANVTVIVDNCYFGASERGMTLVGRFLYVNISNSIFFGNVAMQAGAGLLYLMDSSSTSYVVNCSFENNAGGAVRLEQIKDYLESFQVNVDEVRVHSNCCKGIIAFVGKGGAIRVQRGNLTLSGCHFRNNTARLLGGAVFIDREGHLVVYQTTFENSLLDLHSLEGDLIYSNGNVFINDSRFFALTASNHAAIVRHSGDHWSIEVASVFIQCPVGYRLRVSNSSAYAVTPVGLRRSYRMDQLSYFCESCPRNKYSLDFGFLNYTIEYITVSYYTLLINGQRPESEFTGFYQYHDIMCQQCPYGAKCQQGISALPNFWGYISNDRVRFQRCPKRYCCSTTDCKGFNICAGHRTGVLCGHCEPGYSEALFSPDCIPDSECDPTWLFPVMLSSGILYFLFLLYQKDIRDLMFLHNDVIRDFYCSCNYRSNQRKKDLPNTTKETYFSYDGDGVKTIGEKSREMQNLFDIDDGYNCSSGTQNDNNATTIHETSTVSFGGKSCDGVSSDELLNEASRDYEEILVVQTKHILSSSSTVNFSPPPPPPSTPPLTSPPTPARDMGASFLIIIFFYFQDAQLVHINTAISSRDNKGIAMFKEILSGLFKFRIEFFQFIDKMCFLQGLSATTKLLIRVLLVPYVLIQFGFIYVVYKWCSQIRRTTMGKSAGATGRESEKSPSKFAISLTTGFVLALLFTYQKLATTSLTLLNCVPVGDKRVLFIDGNIVCYQFWQYPVIGYTMTCIIPFCLVLLIGPGLLKDGLVSLTQFFLATIFPPPFLFHWFWIRLVRRPKRPLKNVLLTPESVAMLQILQGPFKEAEVRLIGPICGQGILIGRRLILILLYTFVNDTLIRMLCMMLVCFFILLHHAHVLPYKDKQGNLAGTASASALVVVGGINLVRAAFEAAEYIPHGPNEVLMKVFDEVENTLMLWLPGAVMAFVILSLTVKLCLLTIKYISTCSGSSPRSSNQT